MAPTWGPFLPSTDSQAQSRSAAGLPRRCLSSYPPTPPQLLPLLVHHVYVVIPKLVTSSPVQLGWHAPSLLRPAQPQRFGTWKPPLPWRSHSPLPFRPWFVPHHRAPALPRLQQAGSPLSSGLVCPSATPGSSAVGAGGIPLARVMSIRGDSVGKYRICCRTMQTSLFLV